MDRLYGRPYDRDGRTAAKGKPLEPILKQLLHDSFFRRKPPKTAGREEFGREFVAEFLRRCRGERKEDVVATATALTARSIAEAVRRFASSPSAAKAVPLHPSPEYIISGGGAKNRTLIKLLRAELGPLGLALRSSDEFGVPSAAKEAVAFALLACETWHRRPSNILAATGAHRPAILGKISHVS
jgi:anhydro-N-acetylmuramic acid kinase